MGTFVKRVGAEKYGDIPKDRPSCKRNSCRLNGLRITIWGRKICKYTANYPQGPQLGTFPQPSNQQKVACPHRAKGVRLQRQWQSKGVDLSHGFGWLTVPGIVLLPARPGGRTVFLSAFRQLPRQHNAGDQTVPSTAGRAATQTGKVLQEAARGHLDVHAAR